MLGKRYLSGWMAAIFSCNLILLAGSIAFLTVRVWHGLWFVPFNDEAEHLLGGRVLNVGGHLYQTYIDYHGPVIFMLAQAYGALFGWSAPNYARLILPLLSALAAASIALSPALRSATEKCLGVSLFAGLLAAVWLVQGLYSVSFYPVAGLFAVIGIAAYLAAAWRNLSVPLPLALIAGLSFSLLAFTAYSFGPSVVLFTVSGIWSSMRQKSATLALIVGVAAGGFGVLIWLLFYGDLVGYIVYHIIFNQIVYAPFIHFTFGNFLQSLVPSLSPSKEIQTLGVLCCFLSCALFILTDLSRSPKQSLSIALGHAGILLLNARGGSLFQNGTFLVASFGTLSLAMAVTVGKVSSVKSPMVAVLGTLMVGACIAGTEFASRRALSTPVSLTRAEIVRQPKYIIYHQINNPLFSEVQSVVNPDEKILVIPYDSAFYWSANRLPMDGYYEYLPWSAAYAKHPWFGRDRNICEAINVSPPPLIEFDHSTIWRKKYALPDYMPCMLPILNTKYIRSTAYPSLYVRRDRITAQGDMRP